MKRLIPLMILLTVISCTIFESRDVNNIKDWMPEYTEGMKFVYSVIDSKYTYYSNDTLTFENITSKQYQCSDSVISVSISGNYDIIKMQYIDEQDSTLDYNLIIDNDFHRVFISSDETFSMLEDKIILYRPVKPGTQWQSMVGDQYYSFMIMSIGPEEIAGDMYDEIVYVKSEGGEQDNYNNYWFNVNDGIVKKKISLKTEENLGDPYHTEITRIRATESRLESITR